MNKSPFSSIIKNLQEKIPNFMEKLNIPGLAIAIVSKKEIIWAKGFGYTDKSKKHAVNTDTLFCLESTSKTVTAVAFLLAVQQELVQLDDPIIKFYPEFHVQSRFGDNQGSKITFRHLLSHSSGLAGESRVGGVFDNTPCTWEEHIQGISGSWLKTPVGEGIDYSNAGMDLVAYVLERITGKSFPDYVQEMLGDPLGIRFYYDINEVYAQINAARGYLGDFQAVPEASVAHGCGGAYLSMIDLATFMRFLLNLGTLEKKEILKADYVKAMYSVDGEDGYGLGTIVTRDCGISYPNHPGGGFGLGCEMVWVPDHDIGIASFVNQEYMDLVAFKTLFKDTLKQMLAIKGVKTEFSEFPSLDTPKKVIDPKLLERLVGVYKGIWRPVSIIFRDNKLYLEGSKTELVSHSETTFSSKTSKGLIFNLDNGGKPHSMIYYSPFNGVLTLKYLGRSTDQPGPNRPEWKKYKGIYRFTFYDTEADHQLVKLEKDGYLYVGNQRLYEHESIPNLFFTFTGDAVIFEEEYIYHKNVKGNKINDPVTEMTELVDKTPKHRYLQSWVLDQVVNHLKRLGRADEAEKIENMKKSLS